MGVEGLRRIEAGGQRKENMLDQWTTEPAVRVRDKNSRSFIFHYQMINKRGLGESCVKKRTFFSLLKNRKY